MPLLSKPSAEALERYLESQSALDLTYRQVGVTADAACPRGFRPDHTREQLGEGEAVFEEAKSALLAWRQFEVGWIDCHPPGIELREGQHVVIIARAFGLQFLNAARIVDVVDERSRDRRLCGFAYGTLPGHSACGEERFLVELDGNGAVWYEIRAVSRPRHWFAWLGYPYMRFLQRRFGRDSAAAMRRAVKQTDGQQEQLALRTN